MIRQVRRCLYQSSFQFSMKKCHCQSCSTFCPAHAARLDRKTAPNRMIRLLLLDNFKQQEHKRTSDNGIKVIIVLIPPAPFDKSSVLQRRQEPSRPHRHDRHHHHHHHNNGHDCFLFADVCFHFLYQCERCSVDDMRLPYERTRQYIIPALRERGVQY